MVVKAKDEPSRCESEPESHESFVVQLRQNEPSNFIKKDEYYQIYYFFFFSIVSEIQKCSGTRLVLRV